MAEKYWVSAIASNWNNTANWALSSGGTGGSPVPGSTDLVFFNDSGPGVCRLDITPSVAGISFSDGTLSGTGTINCRGNAFIGSTFLFDDQTLVMDGTSNQILYNQYGCILPSLTIDTIATVTFDGTGPVLIGGNFNLVDGTVNTNGLDIQVGV